MSTRKVNAKHYEVKELRIDYSVRSQTYVLREMNNESSSRFGRLVTENLDDSEALILSVLQYVRKSPNTCYILAYSHTLHQKFSERERKVLEELVQMHNHNVKLY